MNKIKQHVFIAASASAFGVAVACAAGFAVFSLEMSPSSSASVAIVFALSISLSAAIRQHFESLLSLPHRALSLEGLAQALLAVSQVGLYLTLENSTLNYSGLIFYLLVTGLCLGFCLQHKFASKCLETMEEGGREQERGQGRDGFFAQIFRNEVLVWLVFLVVGISLVALSAKVDLASIFLVQAAACFYAAILSFTSPRVGSGVPAISQTMPQTMPQSTEEGIAVSKENDSTGTQLMVLIALISALFLGGFWLTISKMAKLQYSLSLSEFASLQLLFFLGIVVSYVVIHRRERVEQPGQSALFSFLYMSALAFALIKSPTPFGFFCLVFFWGLNSGYALSLCWRMFDHVFAGEMHGVLSERFARIILLAFSIGCGFSAVLLQAFETDKTLMVLCVASVLAFAAFLMTRRLWGLSLHARDE